MGVDAFLARLKEKARSNQLAIAIGSAFSAETALPALAESLQKQFDILFPVANPYEYCSRWNEFVDQLEKKIDRENLWKNVGQQMESAQVGQIHRKVAGIPISNFIDATLDRRLTKALIEGGKTPILHAFRHQRIGDWRQSNPAQPNVFFTFGSFDSFHPWEGLHEQLCIHPQNRIQVENMIEMLRQKDLLLLGFSSAEAEKILHLEYLAAAADKVVNTLDPNGESAYWTKRGVFLANVDTEDVVNCLLPTDLQSYTFWDLPFPNRMLIDIAREKDYDSFISYFSGDKAFAQKVDADLRQRGIRIWRDNAEIDVGDSISEKIEHALKRSYTFSIVLSKEALERPWVKEELRAAYNLRRAEELKILPLLYEDCEIPLFLADYKYADFREEKNYTEQIELLARSIQNAVRRARGKR